MTILPKKKQKNKEDQDDRDKDHQSERYNYSQINNSNQNGQISPNNRPPWSSRAGEDKRPAPDSDHSTDHLNIVGNAHLKRRHRVNRERDVASNVVHDSIQRSLRSSSVTSVRSSISKASSSPSSSPRDLGNVAESELAIPGCSGIRVSNNCEHEVSLHHEEEDIADKNDISGYNSGDEYHKPKEHWTNIDWEEKERSFERKIRKKGFTIKKMNEDGACLFRAVADQVYGDQEMHSSVRKLCMDYMEKNGDYFSQYVTETFSDYLKRKRCENSHGNHIEMQALSEIYNRPIQVYHYSTEPINIFQACDGANENEPIRLSYHRNVHYNSMIDPYKATIGVGLGLPGFKPGIAEKSLMEKAMRISEQHELEQAMLEDKIRATDWEATNEAIEEQIARESYLEWLHESQLRTKKKSSATSTLTKYVDDESNNTCSSPKCYSPRSVVATSVTNTINKSPLRCDSKDHTELRSSNRVNKSANEVQHPDKEPEIFDTTTFNIEEASSFMRQVPPSVLGLNSLEDEDGILARVLAQSQAEYIESLKKGKHQEMNVSTSSSTNSESPAGDFYSSLPSTSSNYRA